MYYIVCVCSDKVISSVCVCVCVCEIADRLDNILLFPAHIYCDSHFDYRDLLIDVLHTIAAAPSFQPSMNCKNAPNLSLKDNSQCKHARWIFLYLYRVPALTLISGLALK